MDHYMLFLTTDDCIKIARYKSDGVVTNAGFGPYDHPPTLEEIRRIHISGNMLMPREEDFTGPFTIVEENYEERLQELAEAEVRMICKGFGFEITCIIIAIVVAIGIAGWQKGYWSATAMCITFTTFAILAGSAWCARSRK